MALVATQTFAERCAPGATFGHNLIAAFDPTCWSYSPGAWAEMAQLPQPSQPKPVLTPPSSILTTAPTSGEAAQQTVDAIVAQNKTAQNQQMLDFFQTVPEIGTSGDNTLLWAAGAVGTVSLILILRRRR